MYAYKNIIKNKNQSIFWDKIINAHHLTRVTIKASCKFLMLKMQLSNAWTHKHDEFICTIDN